MLKWLNKVFEEAKELSHQYAFSGTMISVYSLAFVIRIIISNLNIIRKIEYSLNLAISIYLMIGGVTMSLVSEKLSSGIPDAKLPLDAMEIRKRKQMNTFYKGMVLGLELLSNAFLYDSRSCPLWFASLIFCILGFLFYFRNRITCVSIEDIR